MFPNKDCIDCPPCPPVIPAVPIPDLSHICGGEYKLSCVKYTGPNIPCLEIFSGTMMDEVLAKFNTALAACECCKIPVVNCTVTDWGEWEPEDCTTCLPAAGGGTECTQTRTRTIITQPSGDGTPCPILTETRTVCCRVDCVSHYDYTDCTPAGTRTGTLVITTPASCGGTACPTATTITENCTPNIDCVMSAWGEWSPTCIGGVERRTRTITTQPSGEGAACGPLEETRTGCQPPPFCFPVSGVESNLITVCNQYSHTIEYYACSNCSPVANAILRNTEILTKDLFYYDSISKQKFKVIKYDTCSNSNTIDREIEADSGEINCIDVICPCTRPTGLIQVKLLSSFETSDASPCDPAQVYDILNAPDITAACALFERFKTCVCPDNIDGFTHENIELKSLELGEIIYKSHGVTTCEVVQPGFYFFWDSVSTVPGDYFCDFNTITIVQIGANGVIIDLKENCASCTTYIHTIDIYNCTSCVPVISGMTIRNSERLVVNGFYYDSVSHQRLRVRSYVSCDSGSRTHNILSSSTTGSSCVTCPPCVARPTGLTNGILLSQFGGIESGPGDCIPTQNIRTAPNLLAACEMWDIFKSCICVYGIGVNVITPMQYTSLPLEVGQKLYSLHNGTNCTGTPAGKYFYVDGIATTDVVPYLCPLTTVTVITVGLEGMITAVETCTYVP